MTATHIPITTQKLKKIENRKLLALFSMAILLSYKQLYRQ